MDSGHIAKQRHFFEMSAKELRRALENTPSDIQDFFWDRTDKDQPEVSITEWLPMFQKRVDRIRAIDLENPSYKTELRKRLLQQAALSLRAIIALKETE